MTNIDKFAEAIARGMATRTSRRSIFAQWGGALLGAAVIPALPVARASAAESGANTPNPQDPGDPGTCDYWRYCAIEGSLCSCCGGSVNVCPPGTEMSPITWIGTCRNPADNRNYIISYNDCCGKPNCGRCSCVSNQGERPLARPQANNEVLWCLGMSSPSHQSYTCTVAALVGVASEQH